MDTLVSALHATLLSVRGDGRVPHEVATRLRAATRELQQRRILPSVQKIVAALPDFETLPVNTREHLYSAVLDDDAWSMWLRRATLRQSMTRWVRMLGMKLPSRFVWLRHATGLAEFLFLYWQARLAHMVYRRTLTWRGWNSREPTLACVLQIAGLDARTIAASYLRSTPQPLETAGYWHDPARQVTVGVVVGIDFIVNDDGVWFVESNLNVGLMEERSRLYTVDPFVTNLIQYAKRNGYSSLLFLACNDVPVDDVMAERIQRTAAEAGLRATVLEDRYAPQRRLSQTFLVPPIGERTLVVRSKMFHISLDAIFHHKTLSLMVLEGYQRTFPARDVRLPPTDLEEISRTLRMDGPFPNLVCKFPERDQGQGVVFMKVPTLTRAQEILDDAVEVNRRSVANIWTKLRYRFKLEDQAAVFQPYIPSSLGEDRCLSIVRAHVFASPIGSQFLSAHRVVSELPTPASLAEGLVHDARPYIVNYSLESHHAPIAPEDTARVETAALSVVRGLCWAVEARYQTRPTSQAEVLPIGQPVPGKGADDARSRTGLASRSE